MTIINMFTARYFQEDGKSVCEWIIECRVNAYELGNGVTRGEHGEEMV